MSSLIFLGFSVIAFVISYGIMFMLVPTILAPFFSIEIAITPEWEDTRAETEDIVRWLIPVTAMIGIFMLVIKVLMVASVRGRD